MQCDTASYRTSHTRTGKGADYDAHFRYRYREYLWAQERALLRRIVADHHAPRPVDCLDFACGTGRILEFLEGWTDKTTGVDISDEMLRHARSKLSRTKLVQGDVTSGAVLGDHKYTMITAFRFFLNAEPALRDDGMRALKALLAPDGILVFNNHMNHTSAAGLVTRMNNSLRHGSNKTWRIREMHALVRGSGLVVAEVYHTGVMPGWEHFMFLPSACYRAVDRLASSAGFLRHVAQDVIFVCRQASEGA